MRSGPLLLSLGTISFLRCGFWPLQPYIANDFFRTELLQHSHFFNLLWSMVASLMVTSLCFCRNEFSSFHQRYGGSFLPFYSLARVFLSSLTSTSVRASDASWPGNTNISTQCLPTAALWRVARRVSAFLATFSLT